MSRDAGEARDGWDRDGSGGGWSGSRRAAAGAEQEAARRAGLADRHRLGCHSPIDKSLVLPVRDVTSVLSNASCLSSFENWLEAARLSRSGVLSRAAAGPPAQPTLNRLGP